MEELGGRDLAGVLKELRRTSLGKTVHQGQLGAALGGVSAASISNWENPTSRKRPSVDHLKAYARFFCTQRSIEGDTPRLLDDDKLTETERQARDTLERTLLDLRDEPPQLEDERPRFWTFPPGDRIRIVCGEIAGDDRPRFADPNAPNFVHLSKFTDLDALFSLYASLRHANPTCEVTYHTKSDLPPDAYSGDAHLVIVGGVGWNDLSRDFMDLIRIPIEQEEGDDGSFIFVYQPPEEGAEPVKYEPEVDGRVIRDFGLFVRHVHPSNYARTLTICNGSFTRAVLAMATFLNNPSVRSTNERLIREQIGDQEYFWLLAAVPVVGGSSPLALNLANNEAIQRREAFPPAGAAPPAALVGAGHAISSRA